MTVCRCKTTVCTCPSETPSDPVSAATINVRMSLTVPPITCPACDSEDVRFAMHSLETAVLGRDARTTLARCVTCDHRWVHVETVETATEYNPNEASNGPT